MSHRSPPTTMFRMRAVLTLAMLAAGCPAGDTGTDGGSGDSGATVGSSTAGTTTAPTTSGTATGTSTTEDSTQGDLSTAGDSTSPSPPDMMMSAADCDYDDQDCPDGQKCNIHRADENSPGWDDFSCFPLDPDPVGLGEACVAPNFDFDGLDNCAEHLVCWYGTCVPLCEGGGGLGTCTDPAFQCEPYDFFGLCYARCDPTASACSAKETCLPGKFTGFVCQLDQSGDEGQLYDPCSYQSCDPGLLCVPSHLASECDPNATGCCLPWCDVNEPNTCPGAGQECVGWDKPVPPELEHVGVCAAL